VVEGKQVSLKTPDVYPDGQGIRPQFVIEGRTFRVDVSRARIVLPDEKRPDTQPLKVGDRVLMVLNEPPPGPITPGTAALESQYFATIVERLACADNVTIH
jgi:hypothetical protein